MTIPSDYIVQFSTDPNLEDFLAQELESKLGFTVAVKEPTNKGVISCKINPEQTLTILKHPPTLWTVKKARIHLFTRLFNTSTPFESVISTETEIAARFLQVLKISEINCRIITRQQLILPRRQILGLIKQILKKNDIDLKFQRHLPDYIINLTPSKCRGFVEIGKIFRPHSLVKVHHTPLSPPAAYALYSLARQFQPQNKCVLLDPMCGNGTLLFISSLEARRTGKEFYGIGIDQDVNAITNARENLRDFSRDIILSVGKIEQFDPSSLPIQPTHILTHPPYGFAPAIDSLALEEIYDALFQVFTKFPDSVYGMVTPHQTLVSHLVQKYPIRTVILRPFQQKTLSSFLWVGQYSQK